MVIGVVVLLLAPMVTTCSLFAPSVDEAKADFCAKLGAYGRAVVGLRAIQSTVCSYPPKQ